MSSHGPHANRVKTGLIVAFSLLILASPASAKTIYVSDLHSSTSSDSLRAAFEDFGVVSSAKVFTDPETGKSRGFGFVEMPNDHEAQEAIADLNESNFEHSRILVKAVGPRESSGSRPDGGGFGGNRPGASGGFGSGSTGNRPGGPGGIGGGGRPASQATAPAANAAPHLRLRRRADPNTANARPEPVVAPTQPTPQVPVVGDASDEAPDAETEPLEGTPDPADESETSVADDEDGVIDDEGEAEEEAVEEAEEDGAMTDQESGEDTTDDAAEVSEDDFGQSSGGDEATDFEVGDAVEDDQFEDSSESDGVGDTAEPADEDSVDTDDENGLASR